MLFGGRSADFALFQLMDIKVRLGEMVMLRWFLRQTSRRVMLMPKFYSAPCSYDWRDLPEMLPPARSAANKAGVMIDANPVMHAATIDSVKQVCDSEYHVLSPDASYETASRHNNCQCISDSFDHNVIFEGNSPSAQNEINPANGLPMMGAIDVMGNLYGIDDSFRNSHNQHALVESGFDHTDDGFGGSKSWE
jgi:hypothetical protein